MRSHSWKAAASVGLGFVAFAWSTASCGGKDRSGFADDPNGPRGSSGGASSGDFGPGSGTNVFLDPKNTTVVIDTTPNPATPGTVSFKVFQKTNGGDKDITSSAKLTLKDPSLGTLTGATFTSVASLPPGVLGKSTIVNAETPAGSALGTLTVVVLRKTGEQRDFFFIVPFEQDPTPKNDTLKFSTNIKVADIAFSMDTTFSMNGSIQNLKTALSGTLLTQLQAAIPSVGLAIVDFKDYPADGHGDIGDFPVLVRQVVTTSLGAAQGAVNGYVASGGGDLPEANIPSMQHILTGEALAWPGGALAAHTPAAGTWGGVDFRTGAVPVVVNITDIDWHGEGHSPYAFTTPTMATLKAAFAARNAKFVDVTNNDESQANELSDATGSSVPTTAFGSVPNCAPNQCCTGVNGIGRTPTGPGGTCRLNFLHQSGNGVSAGIVKAIEAIATGTKFDVTARPSNDPKNAKNVDATKFIKSLRAMDEGNAAAGCPAAPAIDTNGDGLKDTFLQVKVGTPVCFEIVPNKNTTVEPAIDPQFFNAFVDVLGMPGSVQLDRRSVLFLVPPKDASVN